MRRILACSLIAALFVFGGPARSAPDPQAELIANLRAHVKHVFVLYQENRSFDSYFGTFPGAENLASADAQLHGFHQHDAIGNQDVTPFRIADPDVSDVNHSRPALYAKVNGGRMDKFVENEEQLRTAAGVSQRNAQILGLLTMAYEDCDTIPFLWKYANSFALFDHFFQGMYGPSTPGNIDIIAAQTGETQAARDPKEATGEDDTGPGEPVVNDVYPAWGPYHNGEPKVKQYDQTYANVLLTLSGRAASQAKANSNWIQRDISLLVHGNRAPISWGWYEEGLKDDGSGKYPALITHHNAPQYFGYIRQNQAMWDNVHDLTEMLPAIQNGKLGDRGVYFMKGGYLNPFGWKPANKDPAIQKAFLGDDDHAAYADSHLSESLVATMVNAIAKSPYWNDSAIVITWDDSEGSYDHVPPPQYGRCPDNRNCGDGPRVPLIVISPYGKTHAVVRDPGDHASFVKFLDVLFDLPPLATLPDEKQYMPRGPRDTAALITDLTGAFDPDRLSGKIPPVPSSEAIIADDVVNTFPPKMSCSSLNIKPVDVPGASATPPRGYSPRTQ